MTKGRLIFVIGTDTGVGKTVLTALLLAHLRRRDSKILAIKPFCSGDRSDPKLLRALHAEELLLDEINPFFFAESVAPLVAARKHRQRVALPEVISFVKTRQRQCHWLLVEGAGGLLAPLGEGFSVLDLIRRLKPTVIVAAANKLGTINHTLLTMRALHNAGIRRIKVALINARRSDEASLSNEKILRELLKSTPLVRIPFLGRNASSARVIRSASRRLASTLQRLLH